MYHVAATVTPGLLYTSSFMHSVRTCCTRTTILKHGRYVYPIYAFIQRGRFDLLPALLINTFLFNNKIYTDTKWKLYTIYNGIYYTWDKNTCTSQCRKWNSIMCRDVKPYQLRSKFIQKKEKIAYDLSDLRSWIPLHIQ